MMQLPFLPDGTQGSFEADPVAIRARSSLS
jgi:hypothetical protein